MSTRGAYAPDRSRRVCQTLRTDAAASRLPPRRPREKSRGRLGPKGARGSGQGRSRAAPGPSPARSGSGNERRRGLTRSAYWAGRRPPGALPAQAGRAPRGGNSGGGPARTAAGEGGAEGPRGTPARQPRPRAPPGKLGEFRGPISSSKTAVSQDRVVLDPRAPPPGRGGGGRPGPRPGADRLPPPGQARRKTPRGGKRGPGPPGKGGAAGVVRAGAAGGAGRAGAGEGWEQNAAGERIRPVEVRGRFARGPGRGVGRGR